MASKPTIAFLGAGGTMGLGMAGNLQRAGFPLHAWNRSPEKAEPLMAGGAQIMATPAEAVEDAAILLSMLSDADAVLDAVGGEEGALASGGSDPLVWVQMSTIGVAGTERCSELAERAGARFVDAPVLGTKQPAEKGELVVLASGPDEVRETLAPVFDAVGKRTMWVGEAGAGSRLKVVTNSWLVAIVEGAAETIALAEGAGIDPALFLEAVAGGPLDAPYLEMKARAMIEGDFEPSFRLSLAAKDAALAAELAERHELDLPLIKLISDRLAEGARAHGADDLSATYLTSAPSR